MNPAPFKVGDKVMFIDKHGVNKEYFVINIYYDRQWWVSVQTQPCPHCGESKDKYFDMPAYLFKILE